MSASTYPKITVITPTFNSAATLEETIQSVVNQTYPNVEFIIVDGVSTDATLAIAEKYCSRIARIVSEPDKGIYDAMNKGLRLATGDWVYFLGSDDVLFTPTTLEEIFTDPLNLECGVVYGNVLFKHANKVHAGEFSLHRLIGNNICHQAIFTRKEVFEITGDFNTTYKACADHAFNLKWFGNKKIKHRFINKIIANYNDQGFSGSYKDYVFRNDQPKLVRENFGLYAYLDVYVFPPYVERYHQAVNSVKNLLRTILPMPMVNFLKRKP